MSDDLQVDPQVLREAADGIDGIIGTLAGLGITETAAAGRGFSVISMSSMESGHIDVEKQLEEFAERWAWGVRTLVQNANAIAENLNLSAGRYHLMDQTVDKMLDTSAEHLNVNPHLGSEQMESFEHANAHLYQNLEVIRNNVSAVIP